MAKIALSGEFQGFFWEISAPEKYFSDSGKWLFHTPPIHTPPKGRPSNSLILHLFAFVCVCSRLRAFACVFGPFSESLKSAFVCVCARSFVFANTSFYYTCVFPVEPQSPNGKNINLHKKWGFRRFQKECHKVRKSAENRTLFA